MKNTKTLILIVFLILSTVVAWAQTPTQVANTDDLVTRIIYPEGATYLGTGTETGAIQIQLPQGYTSTMIRMRVEIYDHKTNESFSTWVSGYTDTNWREISGQILSSSFTQALRIHFGAITLADGSTKASVWIGEETTTWSYLKVSIAEVLLGYGNSSIAAWDDGWDLDVVDSFMANVTKTIENRHALPIAQTADVEEGVSRIVYPEGGAYRGEGTETGAIQIQLPQGYSNTMIRMRVEIYDHKTNESFSAWISGFNATNWREMSGQILTSSFVQALPIRFGAITLADGSVKTAVWIGEETTKWSYAKISIAEVIVGYSNSSISNWDTGWDVDIVSSFMTNVTQTIENRHALPIAQTADVEEGVTRIVYPEGGAYSGSGTETGAVQIQLPQGYSNTMIRMRVEIYDHKTNESFSAWVSGYTSTDWREISGQILTSSFVQALPIRFGAITLADGSVKTAVWIGEETTKWSYVKISIAEVMVGHSHSNISNWDTGWDVNIVPSFMTNTTKVIQAKNVLPVTKMPSERSDNVTRIIYPEGGIYGGTSTETGAIQIQLPQGYSGTMMRMRIEVYDHKTSESFSVWVSGYNTTNWLNPTGQILTSSLTQVLPIHFGAVILEDGSIKTAVWIGEETTTWSHLKVSVAEVILSYANANISQWDDGWDINVVSDFMSNVTKSIEGKQVLPITSMPSERSDGVTRILYPAGGIYGGTNAETGAIQIQLPQAYSSTMMRMRVEIYDHKTAESFSTWVSGYNDTNWREISGQILTSSLTQVLPIHFGAVTLEDGSIKTAVWIGEETTTWSHLKVSIAEVILSYANASISQWDDGWDIKVVDDFMANVTKSIEGKQVLPITKMPSERSEGVTRISYPAGSIYGGTNAETGAIQIQLPQAYSSTMIRMRVEVYDHVANESFSTWISGYNTTNWLHTSGQILTSSEVQTLPIHFGSITLVDGTTKATVWIGEETTTWSYLKVSIPEVILSYNNASISQWDDGWDIKVVDDFMANVNKTIAAKDALPLAKTIWSTQGTNTYTNEQHIAIGLEDPGDFRLAVDGDIKARRIKVTAADWPDYVFEPSYELMSIEELKAYVAEHGHLPNVPSKAQAEAEGVYLNDMNNILLRKVEELTLYIIAQEKESTEFKKEILDRLSKLEQNN